MTVTYYTHKGYQHLVNELEDIQTVQFPRIDKLAAEARVNDDADKMKASYHEHKKYYERMLKLVRTMEKAKIVCPYTNEETGSWLRKKTTLSLYE